MMVLTKYFISLYGKPRSHYEYIHGAIWTDASGQFWAKESYVKFILTFTQGVNWFPVLDCIMHEYWLICFRKMVDTVKTPNKSQMYISQHHNLLKQQRCKLEQDWTWNDQWEV